MARRRVRKALTASAAALALTLFLSGCDDRFPDYSYKMTIYAKGKAFSSVRHVEVEEASSIVDSGGSTVKRRVEGEAVVLDLNGRTYYALLSRPDNADYAQFVAGMALSRFIPLPAQKNDVDQAVDDYRRENSLQDSFGDAASGLQAMVQIEGPRDLPRTLPPRRNRLSMQAWPMFVTFGDPKDPRTVREVSPDAIGVERITIEITDEDVTMGIERRLEWLHALGGRYLTGRSTAVGSPYGMHSGYFEQGKKE